mgnify:CR=1 FL=1
MATVAQAGMPAGTSAGPPAARRLSFAWLGVVPFFLFAILFLVAPTLYLVIGAFQDPAGNFTFANMIGLFQPQIMAAYWISIRVSLASAALGALTNVVVGLRHSRGQETEADTVGLELMARAGFDPADGAVLEDGHAGIQRHALFLQPLNPIDTRTGT